MKRRHRGAQALAAAPDAEQAKRSHSPLTRPRNFLTSPRWLLPSSRRFFDAKRRPGRAPHARRHRHAVDQRLQALQRIGAVHVLAAVLLRLEHQHAFLRDAAVARGEQPLLDRFRQG